MFRSEISCALFLLGAIAMLGCRLVPLQPEAEAVRVLDAAADDCEMLGNTRVEVLENVGIFARNSQKVSDELDTLARNAAAEMGGNAVTASGPIEDGARRYRVLRCP